MLFGSHLNADNILAHTPMKYMGSKRRIWKYIAPIILKNREEKQYYVEPFCGGYNSICQVDGLKIAADINPYLIAMWKDLLHGEKYPETISKEDYEKAKTAYKTNDSTTYSMGELGWTGFMASYNGIFYHSYSGVSASDGKDYVQASIANIYKQIDSRKGCELICCSYENLEIPDNSIIYCDPPYRGTEGYGLAFDYPKFYEWCFLKKSEGHRIFISEYSMPSDFTCIWAMEVANSLDRYSEKRGRRMEKLYTIN